MKNIYTYLFILLVLFVNTPNLAANERYPLEAPDTSSPRATMKTFQTIIRNAKPIVAKVRTSGFSMEITGELRDLQFYATRCLDLSQEPKKLRDDDMGGHRRAKTSLDFYK